MKFNMSGEKESYTNGKKKMGPFCASEQSCHQFYRG